MASREQRLAIVVVAKDLASKTLRGINGELARMAGGRSPLAQVAGGFGTLGAGVARVGSRCASPTPSRPFPRWRCSPF